MEQPISRTKIGIVLGFGLIAISFASIFIRLCDAPSLVIAAYRLVIASTFYLILSKIKLGPIWSKFSWSQRKIALISGIFLTLHFATWITSIKYTSIASSVLLVQSAPIFVALGSTIFLKEKPSLIMIFGIAITLMGSVVISAHDFSLDQNSLIGNLLAIGGAIGAAGYMIAGRKLRATMDTIRYVTTVYSVAAILLVIFAIGSGASFVGYSLKNYLLLFAIAIFPQIFGHTVFNWALKYLSANTIAVILLGEPVGASILALILLGENLSRVKILGGLVIILGVILVLTGEAKQSTKPIRLESS